MSYIVSRVQSDSGQDIYMYEKNGQKIGLNSLYSPGKEAERFIKKLEYLEKNFVILIGFGNGALLEGLLKSKAYDRNIHFLFIEPFCEVEVSDDLANQITSTHKVSFFYAENFNAITFSKYIAKYMSIPVSIQVHPNYSKIEDPVIKDCLQVITDGIETVQVFKNTQAAFAIDWIIEPLLNIRSLPKSMNIKSFQGKYKGERAILVASGPSLKEHIPFLQDNKESFHLFSVGSALRALLVNDIEPDYVVTMDAGATNYETHFKDLNYNGALIYETVSNSKIQDNHKGSLIVSRNIAEHITVQFSDEMYSFTQTSPSVAILALQVIAYLGFSEVYFVGQDLALVDGEYYAKDVQHHEAVKNIKEELLVVNNQGKQVGTTRALKIFLEAFEELIKNLPNEMSLYNLSEQGAKIEGTQFIKESTILKGNKKNSTVPKQLIQSSVDPNHFIQTFIVKLDALKRDVLVASAGLKRHIKIGVVNTNDMSKVLRDFRKASKHTILEDVILANLKFVFNSIVNNIQLLSSEQNNTSKGYLALIKELETFYRLVIAYCDEISKDKRLTQYK
ncbi:motility associated factor glycosyltransferase family protein [Sporosarcina limicola]|uniref:6-hydroxymethylpterin diphosphokinase MptE-like domain-containing protein n=1 Tax=Sporosarcina limicola TaxID=34101 RepID=A0A927RD51_9BACL|nr:6-hydroxymethylpterin diphosphokinase MptE-like protein [Sporosarcina limicola]MBE1555015.1 hypothetical protein [Sporosarcina limicola]